MIDGVRVRIYHQPCGQFTQLRKRIPTRPKVKCPECGGLTEGWTIDAKVKIKDGALNSYWRTKPEEKMCRSLRQVLHSNTV